jgi:hypothetical protein
MGSMENFGIKNGDIVFVNPNLTNIASNSVIVLKILPKETKKIRYKLRKFIAIKSFDNGSQFDKWINDNYPKLKGAYNENKVSDRIIQANESNCRVVISETKIKQHFWKRRKPHCSVHLANTIVGEVQYRVPYNKVCVWKKQ